MWKWVRVAKSTALISFILPWLTVSCSGNKVASASGFNLLTGRLTVGNESMNGSPSLMVGLALLAIIVGLFYAFGSRDGSRNAAPAVVGTSIGALALIFLGTIGINANSLAAAAAARNGDGGGFGSQVANAIISIDYAYGFWLAVLALAISGAIGWMIWQDRSPSDLGPLGERLTALSETIGASGDTAHWDRISDKNDDDALQEYLIRYPQGRFAELARRKLARMNVEPLAPAIAVTPPAVAPLPEIDPVVQSRTCPQCGTRYPGDVKFCTGDGVLLV